jgi:predicted DCC family thiol-disulfide oxidoreductase YuxK
MTIPLAAAVRTPLNGWVLYDGGCGFCSRWVLFWAKTLKRIGLEPAALQEPWVAEKLGMPIDALLADIRLLTVSGALVSGADVYLYVTRRIWWAWPFYAVFSLPGFYWMICAGYRWFARNRHRVSQSCNLRPQ